ncbi:MAG TPA: type II secretion system F family protein [Rhizomicrobium sp.]|jgi:general secretion pathway protein F
MTQYRYRAVLARTGEVKLGTVEGASRAAVFDTLRRSGFLPIDAVEGSSAVKRRPQVTTSAARKALPNVIGELSVLLGAGLPLDRALGIVVDHAAQPQLKSAFAALREQVKAGVPLARAMEDAGGFFSPMTCALTEAGEASGRLGPTLARLAEALERAEGMRQTVTSALVYPAMLLVVAIAVILVMLLLVIPQFEGVISDLGGKVPFATAMVLGVSRFVRAYGLVMLLGLIGLALFTRQALRQPLVRESFDRIVLRVPLLGDLVTRAETARFARTLAGLVDSGVPLVHALGIARRTLSNSRMAAAVSRIAEEVKEGGSLARPFAASGVFPPLAVSFLRTGEETAQFGLMLGRLADVLDRDVRLATQRMMAVMTPVITVVLGMLVAGIIASVMSAILGINDLALQP